MTDITTDPKTELRLERTFDAPREEVFEAWTSPEVLRRWWASGPDWDTPFAETDVRPGGRYRLSMRNPSNGDVHTVAGEYTEVTPPELLAYTWEWEGRDDAPPSTLVTVEFRERDGATTVVLTHTGFASAESRDSHADGWRGCLENLAGRVFASKGS